MIVPERPVCGHQVKKAMKANKDNPAVRRLLDFKQLGLKLIANVTYGYTSANFSGRMPCIEVSPGGNVWRFVCLLIHVNFYLAPMQRPRQGL